MYRWRQKVEQSGGQERAGTGHSGRQCVVGGLQCCPAAPEMLLITINKMWLSVWMDQSCYNSKDVAGFYRAAMNRIFDSFVFFLKGGCSGTCSGQSGWERFNSEKMRTREGRFQRKIPSSWGRTGMAHHHFLLAQSSKHRTLSLCCLLGEISSQELGRPELLTVLPVQSLLAEKHQKSKKKKSKKQNQKKIFFQSIQ